MYKLWFGGAFVEEDCATRVARVCARNGPLCEFITQFKLYSGGHN